MDTPAPPTEQESPPTSPQEYVETLAKKAKATAAQVATLSTTIKDRALLSMAEGLEAKSEEILAANEQDLESLGKEQETQALEDRLRLTPERIAEMAAGLREIAKLPDPLGQAPKLWRRPNGMQVGRVRVPIGVIGIIYESRPNVTADSAGLCLKSGNSCILRGGSEAVHSNTAIAKILAEAAEKAGVPANAIAFVERTEREAALALLKQDQYVDLIIPRGGESLMRTVTEQSTIPVIRHDKGVCHIYVDADADPNMAERICLNAKVQRPGTCNAMETMLVHQTIARTLLPSLVQKLNDAKVEVRGCPRTCQLCPEAKPATESDYGAEFLSLTLAVKVVKNIAEAMEHIATFGSRHTEAIVTSDYSRAFRFLREVDASAVMVNASTRLNDGYQFGLGAEIGISTSRIHARGPMGLEELTCSKFIVLGSGQIRE
ncbi:MAG: glutamate-5-semialdehyde dehydrogenase [Nitrospirae bacterium]|nr:glutamate-5-semialdehyde dehydrogenase [Nitrospirota bacterium]